MAKYSIPVIIHTDASHCIGAVKCDSIKEFEEKSLELWKKKGFDYPTVNISNNFDLGDWDILEVSEEDIEYYKSDERSTSSGSST